jgi:hypothetical protein
MNLEDLNKPQLILLTLLVSFVTSIATGIVTVALLTQTQSPIIRTINNVVERTIQQVSPSDPAPIKTTPAVSENSLVTSAIASASKSLVRIYSVSTAGAAASTTGTFRGIGAVVSSDGVVLVPDSIAVPGRVYAAVIADGTEIPITIMSEGRGDTALMHMTLSSSTPSLSPATLGTPESLSLGETAIALSGETRTAAAVGIISDIAPGSTSGAIGSIDATTPVSKTPGSMLLNDQGMLIGLYIAETDLYSPVSAAILTELTKPLTEKPADTSSSTVSSRTASSIH